ncbi:pilus assembly protein TadG-related protein [Lysobacter sp. F60174L2]|uniref:pilus assembly protein TadG-related protein n=1 Tax=Lysobacter sp. F60174L2 TaxID=3459295 RepID=UPI00403DDF4C
MPMDTPSILRAPRGARRYGRGQALILGLVFLMVLCVGAILLFNTGQTVTKKIQLTNSADAAAYSVAVQQARTWNFAAYMNRGRVANEVAIAQMVSMYSWLNQTNDSTITLWKVLRWGQAIPYVGAAFKAAVQIFKAIDQGMRVARRAFHVAASAGIPILDGFNQVFADASRLMIEAAGGAEAGMVIQDVVEANSPKARVSPASWVLLSSQYVFAKDKFLQAHNVRAGKRSRGGDRYRNVVMESRDEFSRDRSDELNLFLFGWEAKGGTDMVDYNRWAALDVMDGEVFFGVFKGAFGNGGAQALPSGTKNFYPGIRSGRNNGSGWYSDYDRRTYAAYNGIGQRRGRKAQRDPNVRAANGQRRGAYFRGYHGLSDYHDVADRSGHRYGREPEGEDAGPTFTVEVELDNADLRTAHRVGLGAGRMELKEQTQKNRMAAMSSAQIYFNRPNSLFPRVIRGKTDRHRESGSLFSPYWQVRLVETPLAARTALGIGGVVAP